MADDERDKITVNIKLTTEERDLLRDLCAVEHRSYRDQIAWMARRRLDEIQREREQNADPA